MIDFDPQISTFSVEKPVLKTSFAWKTCDKSVFNLPAGFFFKPWINPSAPLIGPGAVFLIWFKVKSYSRIMFSATHRQLVVVDRDAILQFSAGYNSSFEGFLNLRFYSDLKGAPVLDTNIFNMCSYGCLHLKFYYFLICYPYLLKSLVLQKWPWIKILN
jgi:hypothetical protein